MEGILNLLGIGGHVVVRQEGALWFTRRAGRIDDDVRLGIGEVIWEGRSCRLIRFDIGVDVELMDLSFQIAGTGMFGPIKNLIGQQVGTAD